MRYSVYWLFLWCLISSPAYAWKQPTHQEIVRDSLAYMNSSYATPEQQRAYDFYIAAAGSYEVAAETMAQAAYDVDEFKDTHLGEWWMPYMHAPLGKVGESFVQYTSYWHFLNMTRGEDEHGNDHGGYDYRYHTADVNWWTNIDDMAKFFFYNLQLQASDYDTTEAHYRLDSFSDPSQYEDFQKIPWQPIDNLAKYWYDQFIANPSLDMMGFVLHASGDVAQPHHVWVTSGNGHAAWEAWVEDYYQQEDLANFAAVAAVITEYDAKQPVRNILTQTAEIAYAHPEVLYNKDNDTRLTVGRAVIPHAIACTVTILTKGANYFYTNNQQAKL